MPRSILGGFGFEGDALSCREASSTVSVRDCTLEQLARLSRPPVVGKRIVPITSSRRGMRPLGAQRPLPLPGGAVLVLL